MEFDVDSSKLPHLPGDVCMVQPTNLPHIVDMFYSVFPYFRDQKNKRCVGNFGK